MRSWNTWAESPGRSRRGGGLVGVPNPVTSQAPEPNSAAPGPESGMVKRASLPRTSRQLAMVTSWIGTPPWNRSSAIVRVVVSQRLSALLHSPGNQSFASSHPVG